MLEDDTYRLVAHAKIGPNHWDDTLESSAVTRSIIFGADTHVFIEDHQDMSMTVGIVGKVPSAVFLALLAGGYIPLKREGVRVNYAIVTRVDTVSLFGFDVSDQYIAGFDTGASAVLA